MTNIAVFFLCQGTHTDLVVQIVLIAESMRLQAMMATYGIQTQTPHEVEPVQILSSTQLVKVYQKLGVNNKLNLQGRPARPIGSLGTSKVSIIAVPYSPSSIIYFNLINDFKFLAYLHQNFISNSYFKFILLHV